MRRIVTISGFVTIALSIYLGAAAFLLRALVFAPSWGRGSTTVATILLLALASTPMLLPLCERLFPSAPLKILHWTTYPFMGFAFYALVGLGLSSFLLWILDPFLATFSPVSVARWQAGLVVLAATGASVAGAISVRSGPRINRQRIELDRWPRGLDGFRIVQLSDVHLGTMLDERFAHFLVSAVNELAPDLIAITGDLVDGPVTRFGEAASPLAALSAPQGVFFVTGNHEYYSGANAWLDHIRTLGIQTLRNEHSTIELPGGPFELAGVDDHRSHLFGHGEDVPKAVGGCGANRAVVLLAHDPATFPAAVEEGVDLQLSGHTHGGQIWPFGLLVKLAVGFVAGHYRRGSSQLLVSRGTGYWGPPMRVGAPAEITEITLQASDAQSASERGN